MTLTKKPALVFCGQSQMVVGPSQFWNLELDADIAKASAAVPIYPPLPISTLDTRKLIWNDSEGLWEAIDVFRNASGGSWGDGVPNTFGPQMVLAHAFMGRHGEAWIMWLGYAGSAMSPDTNNASWSPVTPQVIVATCTVATAGLMTTATITAAPGTFSGLQNGLSLQIEGSVLGWLDFAGGSNTHPLRDFVDVADLGGNNTHYGRAVHVTGISGDGSTLTVTGAAAAGVTYKFANEGPLSLTLHYGPIPLRELAERAIDAAVEYAADHLGVELDWKLTGTIQGESDLGRTQGQYAADLTSHVEWLRDLLGIDADASTCQCAVPHCIVKLSPHTSDNTDEAVAAIRAAQDQVVAALPNLYSVETDKLKIQFEGGATWPVVARVDRGVHYTCQSLNRMGRMIDQGYGAQTSAPEVATSFDGPVGAAGDAQPLLDPYPGDDDLDDSAVTWSEVDICNLALSNIGASARVTSIDPPDGSTEALQCARYYRLVRDSLLEQTWSFNLRRAAGSIVATNIDEQWEYAYAMPSDALTVLAVLPAGASDDDPGRNYKVEMRGSKRVIATDEPQAIIRYTARVSDTKVYTATFVQALAWSLAATLAGAIIKGDAGANEAKRCLAMMEGMRGKAADVDSKNRHGRVQHVPSFVRARGGAANPLRGSENTLDG